MQAGGNYMADKSSARLFDLYGIFYFKLAKVWSVSVNFFLKKVESSMLQRKLLS